MEFTTPRVNESLAYWAIESTIFVFIRYRAVLICMGGVRVGREDLQSTQKGAGQKQEKLEGRTLWR